jgi:hypothetical protein
MAWAIIGQVDARTQHQWPVKGALRAHLLEQSGGGEGAFFVSLAGGGDNVGLGHSVREARGVESRQTQAVCRGRWGWEGTLVGMSYGE